MNQKLFCVADGGGTKTEFLLISDSGNLLARCLLQGCNPNQVGIIEACNTLSRGFEELQRNCNSSEIQGYYAGIAGALSGQNAEKMQNALRAKFSPMIVESDIMNVIYTSRNPSACIAAIAGTGSAVFGYDGNELFRMGGWGYLLDDAGSGYAIGRDLLRFCLSVEENGFGSEWPGLQRIHEQIGGTLLTHLDRIYADGPQCVASFAPLAFDLAREGDETALHIIRKNASYLAERILSVREQCLCE